MKLVEKFSALSAELLETLAIVCEGRKIKRELGDFVVPYIPGF